MIYQSNKYNLKKMLMSKFHVFNYLIDPNFIKQIMLKYTKLFDLTKMIYLAKI